MCGDMFRAAFDLKVHTVLEHRTINLPPAACHLPRDRLRHTEALLRRDNAYNSGILHHSLQFWHTRCFFFRVAGVPARQARAASQVNYPPLIEDG